MDPRLRDIQYLDSLASKPTNDAQALAAEELRNFINREDAFSYVPLIFQNAATPNLLFAAIKIIESHIANNWLAMSMDEHVELRDFVIQNIRAGCPVHAIILDLIKIEAQIAIRSYPDEWPEFLDTICADPMDFQLFDEFMEQLSHVNASIVTPQRVASTMEKIKELVPSLLQQFINNFGSPETHAPFRQVIKYVKIEHLKKCDITSILNTYDPNYFEPICSLLTVEGLPPDFLHPVFQIAATLEGVDPDSYIKIIPVLEQYNSVLEQQQSIQFLNDVHLKLLQLDFNQLIDYWEPFVLSIYEEFKRTESTRFTIHFQTLTMIRDYVITHMTKPQDFIIPDMYESSTNSHDESEKILNEQLRSIIICFIGMTPDEVIKTVDAKIDELSQKYSEESFLPIIWSLACITGLTSSVIEAFFVVKSLRFILDLVKLPKPGVVKPVVASAFLYLSAAYARSQKLTDQFVEVALNLAIQALTSERTQCIAANTILSIAKNSPKLIPKIPLALEETIINGVLPPDVYCVYCEAAARILIVKNKGNTALSILQNRWDINDINQILMYMNGLVGYSRARSDIVLDFIIQNRNDLIDLTQRISDVIMGESQDTIRILRGILKAETILFKELVFTDCGDILQLYQDITPEYRWAEALQLVEVLLKTQLEPMIINGIKDTVITPTEVMIRDSPSDFWEHAIAIPRVILALAQSSFDSITRDDVQFLIDSLHQSNIMATLNTIKALQYIIESADLKLVEGLRDDFFSSFLPPIIVNLTILVVDPSYSSCFPELSRILHMLFTYVGTGVVQTKYVEDPEVSPQLGLSDVLAKELVHIFPLATVQELFNLFSLMLKPRTQEEFDDYLILLISRCRQTTPGETLWFLKFQKFKEQTAELNY